MAWIASEETVWEHYKTIKLCLLLNRPDYAVVGHLHSLWHFVLRNAWRDGNLEKWGELGIEKAARWDGESGLFVKSMRSCGFIENFSIHDWLEFAGPLVLDRIYNEQRHKNKVLRRKNGDVRRKNGDVRRKNGDVRRKNGDVRRKSLATLPYRTVQKRGRETEAIKGNVREQGNNTPLALERGVMV